MKFCIGCNHSGRAVFVSMMVLGASFFSLTVGIETCEAVTAAIPTGPSIPSFSVDTVQGSVGSVKFCSAANGSPGYMPQCDKISSENCTKKRLNADMEKSTDSNGDCGAGQLKVQRFNASAERETVCLDVSSCGSNVALCQRWNSTDKVVRYSCVTNASIQLGK